MSNKIDCHEVDEYFHTVSEEEFEMYQDDYKGCLTDEERELFEHLTNEELK